MFPETPGSPADCHFAAPVRFGRRKTDQVGHLLLTTAGLLFRGTIEMSLAWTEVSHVERNGRQLRVSRAGTQRLLCFCCQTDDEAARAAIVANHLAALAQAAQFEST